MSRTADIGNLFGPSLADKNRVCTLLLGNGVVDRLTVLVLSLDQIRLHLVVGSILQEPFIVLTNQPLTLETVDSWNPGDHPVLD